MFFFIGLLALFSFHIQTADIIDLAAALDDYGRVDSSLTLSPDGTMAAWSAGDALCIYTIADDEADCVKWPEAFAPGFDRYHRLNWSPDSTKLTFTENLFVYFNESDVWTYDLASGEFANRTPDDEVRIRLGSGIQYQLDYAPFWGYDGELYFFRSPGFGDDSAIELYRLAPDSDTPELVADLTGKIPGGSIYIPPAISPDGQQAAVIVLMPTLTEVRNGVWVIDFEDGSLVRAAAISALRTGFPDWQQTDRLYPLGVAWANNAALIVVQLDTDFAASVGQNYHYIDLDTLEVTPLVDLTGIESPEDAFAFDDDGHSGIYQMPRVGFIGDGVFYFAHYDVGSEDLISISAVPLPPDGSDPQPVGDVEGCAVGRLPGDPRFLSTLTESGRALLYNCLVILPV